MKALAEYYVLRARVIEGEIPMPNDNREEYKSLNPTNFEIFAPYTKENLYALYNIGKDAWKEGKLSKFEIIGWAGGVNNHEPERFLWSFRPDQYNFETLPDYLLYDFDKALPNTNLDYHKGVYEPSWETLKFGFSLSAYKDMALDVPLPSLLEKMNDAAKRAKMNTKKETPVKENDPVR